jgi:hypothetical protein
MATTVQAGANAIASSLTRMHGMVVELPLEAGEYKGLAKGEIPEGEGIISVRVWRGVRRRW